MQALILALILSLLRVAGLVAQPIPTQTVAVMVVQAAAVLGTLMVT
jgi:hypothetical protein